MSLDQPMTIGVCAVGGPDQPKPTPEATSWVLVVTFDRHRLVATSHRWDGYAVADLAAHWTKRAKDAGWVTHSRGKHHRTTVTKDVTERREWYDHEPTGADIGRAVEAALADHLRADEQETDDER